jgi:hypothetical protein
LGGAADALRANSKLTAAEGKDIAEAINNAMKTIKAYSLFNPDSYRDYSNNLQEAPTELSKL